MDSLSILPFRVGVACIVLLLAALLCIFVSPLAVLVPLAGAVVLWIPFRHPVSMLGAVLAFMPIDFMAIALGKFFGLPHMTLVSVCDKELILILLAFILWRQNGFKLAIPDCLLLACFALAGIRTVLDGTVVALWTDFNFVIPYFVGRMAVLTREQEQLWARCAVWIAAILAMLGLIEVFILGEGPRTLLYLAIDSEIEGTALPAAFFGVGFAGLREAATMVGPNDFGVLCMIALIVWWVYCRNPVPAGMVVIGLICAVTRGAWLGTAVTIPLLAVLMGQRKRFFLYAALALALFAASIPVLGLSDYLFYTKTGQDLSMDYHRERITSGLKYAADHPFGGGNAKLSPVVIKQESNVTVFETTYPYLAAAYGIAVALCFIGFLFGAVYIAWRSQSQLGYTAVGILIGISIVMIFTLPLNNRRLACWAFFPVGLAVRSCLECSSSRTGGQREKPRVGPARPNQLQS